MLCEFKLRSSAKMCRTTLAPLAPLRREGPGEKGARISTCRSIPICRARRAFSLVELIVVMVILGMLAGLVAVRTRGYLINSKQNAAKTEIANIIKALESFYATEGRYPTTDEGLEILTQASDSFPDGLLTKLPKDPWKRPYEYVSPGSSQPYEVICLGADGREGGDGEDKDFTSETLGDDA